MKYGRKRAGQNRFLIIRVRSSEQNTCGEDNAEDEHYRKSGFARLFHLDGYDEACAVYKEQKRIRKREVCAQKLFKAEQQRHGERRGRDGNAEIMLALFGRLLLTGLLGDIVICKSYKSRKGERRHDGDLPPSRGADIIAYGNGQYTEADHITERIELDAVTTLLIGAVLLGTGDDAVKHIAEAGKHETNDRSGDIAAAGKADTYDRRKHSDIGQPDGVVIKTYHRKNISNSCGILTITQPHHIMQALSTHFYQADTLCKRENG